MDLVDWHDNSLQGKVGIITGGTSGFGYEIVKYLLQRETKLMVFSIDPLNEKQASEIFLKYNGNVKFIEKDIMDDIAAGEMVRSTIEEFGQLDFVVVNAGFAIRFEKSFLSIKPEELTKSFRTQFDVFPIPFVAIAQAAAKEMAPRYSGVEPMENGHLPETGSIIVNLSEAVRNPLRDDLIAYSAAKNACKSIMRSLAGILGPYNIRVNGIAPGFANTEGPGKFYNKYPAIKEDIEKKNHLKPAFMHPASILPAIDYLLSDNYVTGETIALDGGYNIYIAKFFQEKKE